MNEIEIRYNVMIFEIENEDRKRKKEERGGDSYGSDDCGEGE